MNTKKDGQVFSRYLYRFKKQMSTDSTSLTSGQKKVATAGLF